jgi:hypothetical protein
VSKERWAALRARAAAAGFTIQSRRTNPAIVKHAAWALLSNPMPCPGSVWGIQYGRTLAEIETLIAEKEAANVRPESPARV